MERVGPENESSSLLALGLKHEVGIIMNTYGFPPMRPGGSGRVGSTAPGRGGLNPLKTPGGGSPSANG
jgi:hypothetical protein